MIMREYQWRYILMDIINKGIGKIIINKFILLIFCISGFLNIQHLKAQSLVDMEGYLIATKVNDYTLNVTGSIFTIKDGKLIETIQGQEREDLPVNYYIQEDNRVKYFNSEGRHVGFYVPSENRYYHYNPGKQEEEVHIALLYNNEIYTIDENPSYKIDEGFDPVWVGYILFFFLMIN